MKEKIFKITTFTHCHFSPRKVKDYLKESKFPTEIYIGACLKLYPFRNNSHGIPRTIFLTLSSRLAALHDPCRHYVFSPVLNPDKLTVAF